MFPSFFVGFFLFFCMYVSLCQLQQTWFIWWYVPKKLQKDNIFDNEYKIQHCLLFCGENFLKLCFFGKGRIRFFWDKSEFS